MNSRQLTIAVGVASAVIAFLLVQPDVFLPPLAKVVLGAAQVALTVYARLSDPAPAP